MSVKHALVVDDSKSARLSLKKMLETHHLVVELAESGEAALDFLEHQTVDVIFMDHTMPGMDGLEAVAALKRNPRTAMIPVMMYTTKEGEVYVGQARALGAIGVLPKEVQPHELFDMMVKLGLVADKRKSESTDPGIIPGRRADDERLSGQSPQFPGIALESLVRRIIDDQRSLRMELMDSHQELMDSHRDFARRVATEIQDERSAIAAPLESTVPAEVNRRPIWIGLLSVVALVLAGLLWQARSGREAAIESADRATEQSASESSQVTELRNLLSTERTYAEHSLFSAIDALQWALNRNSAVEFDEYAFDDARAEELAELLRRLQTLDFRGRIRIESHLGEFCLEADDSGFYQLATPDATLEICSAIGHPLDDSSFVSERQSVSFAEFMTLSPLVNDSGVEVELIAHDAAHSLRRHPFPADVALAGDWNRIAERNNRLEFSLVIDRSATRAAVRGEP